MKAISYHFRLKEQYTSFRCRCTACEKYQFDITVCDEHNLWRLTSQIKNKGTKLLSEMPELAIVSLLITNIFYLVERMFLHVLQLCYCNQSIDNIQQQKHLKCNEHKLAGIQLYNITYRLVPSMKLDVCMLYEVIQPELDNNNNLDWPE